VEVSTIADAIDVLGGEIALAAWLQIPRTELRRMRELQRFERGFFAQIFLSLQSAGFSATPALFGLSSWEPLIMPRVSPGRKASRRRRVA